MKKQFSIDTDIYSLEALHEAIEDYKEVCDISLKKDMLEFSGEDEEEISILFHEFMNYVISL